MNACCQQVHSSRQVVDSRNYSSASLPRLRCPATTPADFLTLAPPAAAAAGGGLVVADPPAADPAAAAPLLAAWELGLVVEDEENMRSASRKRLIRRIAPLLACLPRYPSQPRKMLPSLTVSCSRTREKDRKKPREWSHDEEIARDSGWGRAGACLQVLALKLVDLTLHSAQLLLKIALFLENCGRGRCRLHRKVRFTFHSQCLEFDTQDSEEPLDPHTARHHSQMFTDLVHSLTLPHAPACHGMAPGSAVLSSARFPLLGDERTGAAAAGLACDDSVSLPILRGDERHLARRP